MIGRCVRFDQRSPRLPLAWRTPGAGMKVAALGWIGFATQNERSEPIIFDFIFGKKSEIEAPQRIIAGAKRFVLRQRTARVRFGSSA